MADGSLRVGVVGTGGMGGRHARNLAHRVSGAEVVAIMDLDRERAAAVAGECRGARVFGSGPDLIHDDAVEAVLIASPDPTHADLAVACIEAGKPVLCEKPLGVDIEDAKRVLDAEVAGGRKLVQVGLMRTFDPQHTALKRAIDAGEIGRPLLFRGIHAHWRAPEVRTAVNVIVNSAVHDIHSARWLMGDDVASVYTSHVVDVPEQPDSTRLVLLQLTFRGGGLGCDRGEPRLQLRLRGRRRDLRRERGTLRTPSRRRAPSCARTGGRRARSRPTGSNGSRSAYRIEAEAWVRAARAGAERPARPSWGRLLRRCGSPRPRNGRSRPAALKSVPRRAASRPVRTNGVRVSFPDRPPRPLFFGSLYP